MNEDGITDSLWKVLLCRYLVLNVQLIYWISYYSCTLFSSQYMTTNHIVLLNYLYPYLVTFMKGGERNDYVISMKSERGFSNKEGLILNLN